MERQVDKDKRERQKEVHVWRRTQDTQTLCRSLQNMWTVQFRELLTVTLACLVIKAPNSALSSRDLLQSDRKTPASPLMLLLDTTLLSFVWNSALWGGPRDNKQETTQLVSLSHTHREREQKKKIQVYMYIRLYVYYTQFILSTYTTCTRLFCNIYLHLI